MARILAVDYGERRLGLALSDPTGTLASPLPTLRRRRGKRPPISEIVRIAQERGAERLVVGLPLSLAGEETAWTLEVREFGEKLAQRAGLPVEFVDERLSSVQAERAVRSSGLPKAKREEKERIDAAAAAIILQSYLDRSGA